MVASHLSRVAGELVAQVERRVAGAPRVVLVRDRRAEQGHDAVARELVDRSLEAVDAFAEEREEAVHDLTPLLGVHLPGELHRAGDVGEHDRHLLALALERDGLGSDPLLEVARRVEAEVGIRRDALARRQRGRRKGRAARRAELLPGCYGRATLGAVKLLRDRRPALAAEASVVGVRMSASLAVHCLAWPSSPNRLGSARNQVDSATRRVYPVDLDCDRVAQAQSPPAVLADKRRLRLVQLPAVGSPRSPRRRSG